VFISKLTQIKAKHLKAILIAFSSFCGLYVSILNVSYADPMRPPGFGVVSTKSEYRSTSFQLSQILISKEQGAERKRAVINEVLVSEGDSISGAKVLRIEPEKVTIKVNGKKNVLVISDAKGFKIKRESE